MIPLAGEPITILSAPLADGYGGSLLPDWESATETAATGVLQPANGRKRGNGRTQLTGYAALYLPAGTPISGTDRVRTADGTLWQVDEPPRPWRGPAGPHHIEVRLRRDDGG